MAGCTTAGADPVTSPTPTIASHFGGTDLAWIEINIAMNEELLPLLDLVPQRSGRPDVQAMAQQTKTFTDAELTALRELHDQAGLPKENPHKNMPMPGMVTSDQVTKAAKLAGKEFDTLVLKALQEHLEQSEKLAGSEDRSGVEPQTRALALQIIRTRHAALSSIKEAS
ncbi:hypothetical protein DMB66_51215 [Actinoplanes sp. ATCC 53533]|nr:hypothetical protein DMB66_51215 [Actinoplanes sp. ATCC 53533]